MSEDQQADDELSEGMATEIPFNINHQYVKDLSFESPAAPAQRFRAPSGPFGAFSSALQRLHRGRHRLLEEARNLGDVEHAHAAPAAFVHDLVERRRRRRGDAERVPGAAERAERAGEGGRLRHALG